MTHDALTQNPPGTYQSLLQTTHTTGERVTGVTHRVSGEFAARRREN